MASPTPPPLALITGGEGDLAAEMAKALVAEGYEVLTPGRRELDVSVSDSVQAYFDRLETIDVLINNAGIAGDGLLLR